MTWQAYLDYSSEKLLIRYIELCEDIAGREEELGMILAEEKRSRAAGFHTSEATTVTGQERDASLAAVEDTAEYLKNRGALAALREEKEVVARLLDRSYASAAD